MKPVSEHTWRDLCRQGPVGLHRRRFIGRDVWQHHMLKQDHVDLHNLRCQLVGDFAFSGGSFGIGSNTFSPVFARFGPDLVLHWRVKGDIAEGRLLHKEAMPMCNFAILPGNQICSMENDPGEMDKKDMISEKKPHQNNYFVFLHDIALYSHSQLRADT